MFYALYLRRETPPLLNEVESYNFAVCLQINDSFMHFADRGARRGNGAAAGKSQVFKLDFL